MNLLSYRDWFWPALLVIIFVSCQPIWASLPCSDAVGSSNGKTVKLGVAERSFQVMKRQYESIEIDILLKEYKHLSQEIIQIADAIGEVVKTLERNKIAYPKNLKIILDPIGEHHAGTTAISLKPEADLFTGLHEFFHTVFNMRLIYEKSIDPTLYKRMDEHFLSDANYTKNEALTLLERLSELQESSKKDSQIKMASFKERNDRTRKINESINFSQVQEFIVTLEYAELLADLGPTIFGQKIPTRHDIEGSREFDSSKELKDWTPVNEAPHYSTTPIRSLLGKIMEKNTAESNWDLFKVVMEASTSEVLTRLNNPKLYEISPQEINERLIQLIQD